jgi:hypothetical protein
MAGGDGPNVGTFANAENKEKPQICRANLFSDMFNVARKLVAQITTVPTVSAQSMNVKD